MLIGYEDYLLNLKVRTENEDVNCQKHDRIKCISFLRRRLPWKEIEGIVIDPWFLYSFWKETLWLKPCVQKYTHFCNDFKVTVMTSTTFLGLYASNWWKSFPNLGCKLIKWPFLVMIFSIPSEVVGWICVGAFQYVSWFNHIWFGFQSLYFCFGHEFMI